MRISAPSALSTSLALNALGTGSCHTRHLTSTTVPFHSSASMLRNSTSAAIVSLSKLIVCTCARATALSAQHSTSAANIAACSLFRNTARKNNTLRCLRCASDALLRLVHERSLVHNAAHELVPNALVHLIRRLVVVAAVGALAQAPRA